MRKETEFWHKIRPHLLGHVTRIENWATCGIPDIHGCFSGLDYWIETKIGENGRIKIRPNQVGWHMSYNQEGGRSWFLVYWPEKSCVELYRGGDAMRLAAEHRKVPPYREYPWPLTTEAW